MSAMNSTKVSAKTILTLLAWAWFFGLASQANAQLPLAGAEIRAVQGTATYATNGGPARPLKSGQILGSGAVIKTGIGSTVDLFLSPNTGLIRLKEKSVLGIDKLNAIETGAET